METRKFERYVAEGDGISLLVELKDGKGEVVHYGDEYHDSIERFIDGYLEGTKETYNVEIVGKMWTSIYDVDSFVWEDEKDNEGSPTYHFAKQNA